MSVLFEEQRGVGVITLNRPQALNALSLEMFEQLHAQLDAWDCPIVIQGAGRAFCAGGDVRTVARTPRAQQGELFRQEYRLNARIAELQKPWVAYADGVTMGGGCGVSVHGSQCIATERSVFAMPEVFIGFVPDVGATRFLNDCPGELGLYLGLTGASIGAQDALYCGLATHGPAGPSRLATLQPAIDRCFSASSVAEIRERLQREDADWAREALAAMDRASPTSLELVLRQLRRGKSLSLRDALKVEYRLVQHVLDGHDFYEGIRAVLVDKDKKPRWQPVPSEAELEAYFAPLPAQEELW